jgi:hypothetical protein
MIRSDPATRRAFVILPIVLATIGGLIAASRSRPAGSQQAGSQLTLADDSPQSCITRLLAAERSGDTNAYLSCFSEEQRTALQTSWRQRPNRQTSAELRYRSAGMVGHAVSDVEFAEPDRATLILERIEKDHTERQRVDLSRRAGRWQIAKLAAADWQRPAIPYGTPVFTPRRDSDTKSAY